MLDPGHKDQSVRVRRWPGQPTVPEHGAEDKAQRLKQQSETVAQVARSGQDQCVAGAGAEAQHENEERWALR
eukprot:5077114-Amphidinium_carterae.1